MRLPAVNRTDPFDAITALGRTETEAGPTFPPSSQENDDVHAVAETTLPPCTVMETSGASGVEPLKIPAGTAAAVTRSVARAEVITCGYLIEHEQ